MQNNLNADVVIVGSGVAGSLIASTLASAGLNVLILEAGEMIDRDKAVKTYQETPNRSIDKPYIPTKYAPFPYLTEPDKYFVKGGPDNFGSSYVRAAGGTTWHWLGTALRLTPNDFKLKSTYGVGVDWPIGYNDLEPYYAKAETQLGVSGNSQDDLGSPRNNSYPNPALDFTYSDLKLKPVLEKLGLIVSQTPQARNSKPYQNRKPCCGNASCIPICPIQAKYDATVHLNMAIEAGARLLTNSVATFVQADPDGNIIGIKFKDTEGEKTAKGKLYVIAAHSIETPKLLLMSKDGQYPNGVANSSDQVGRNLMDNLTLLAYAVHPENLYPYRSPLSTAGIENLHDGAFRRNRSAFRIEIGNDGWSWPVGFPPDYAVWLNQTKNLYGKDLRDQVAKDVPKQFRFAFLTESLPSPDNRIVPDFDNLDTFGIPRPKIYYKYDDYSLAGQKEGQILASQMFSALGATEVGFEYNQGAGHINGTCKMGDDPKTSVVDKNQKTHDHNNLFIAGSSVFPTEGTNNPTLTIAAMSIRLAEFIQKEIKKYI
ncbi:MAG TPA: GMC family oxidoreductase [Ignavibacteria bacterium]|nr:GMC family oxidoreductase [Ignavibacteria bacterium]